MSGKSRETELKEQLIEASYVAVEQLISVAEEVILKPIKRKKGKKASESEESDVFDDLAADRMKNAAAAKKLAIFDAFEILSRIETEKELMKAAESGENKDLGKGGFAERRSVGRKITNNPGK